METQLRIECTCTKQISYAMQQNYIPAVRRLCVHSECDETLTDIRIRLTPSPAFAAPFETTLASLPPHEQVEISPVRLVMSTEMLSGLTERLVASVTVEALSGEDVLFTDTQEIELLAADQWCGIGVMPELTAAFITPNHPKIAELTRKAAAYLQKWDGDPAFTGYQTQDPNQVKKQMAAIYAALQEEGIAYTVPPASFEKAGQRVRLPHAVLEQKCGTCLDLSLLYAACAESVGLRPLVVFIEGHAFAGCWLEEETFADCTVDDPAALTKRIAAGIDAIALVECTNFTAGQSVDFDKAEKHANAHLDDPSQFQIVLDVLRCRGSGIRPLPLQADGSFSAEGYGPADEITGTPQEIDLSRRGLRIDATGEVTRQVIWERKLLDLSLRNSLLNFRPGTMSLQFMTADLSRLEDEIAKGESFRVMPAPSEVHLALADTKIFEIENEKDLITSIAEAEFKSRRLRSFLTESELEKVLKKLHRQAKVSLEENGANTLYLALGFLRWFETDRSTRPRYAPLVLVPVDLVRRITDKSYSLRLRGDETQMNITLLEMLRQDHGITIGGLDPLPEDENGVDLPVVFNTIRQAVMSKGRWDVEELAFLGQFSFSHFIMWNDIRNRSEELRENKVVASLISGAMQWEPGNADLSPSELDEKVAPSDMAVPTSADSSQLAAIYAASQGESFVLHGPPGTGKSQTITNMIANALYQGKSVLFVAEKMAALSVVQKRLAAMGLDPFCLELHSNKSQKRAVLDQLEHTLSIGHVKSPADYERVAEDLKSRRAALNEIMTALHTDLPIGLSIYDAIARYEQLIEYKDRITLEPDLPARFTHADYLDAEETLTRLAAAGRELGGLASSPLKNYRRTDYSIAVRDSLRSAARSLTDTADDAMEAYRALGAALGVSLPERYEAYRDTLAALDAVRGGDYLPEAITGPTPLETRADDLAALLGTCRMLSEQRAKILGTFEESVLYVDGASAKMNWKRNEQKWFLPKAIGRSKLLKEMQLHAKSPSAVTAESYVSICEMLEMYAQLRERVANADPALTTCLGRLWQGEQTDTERIERVRQNTLDVRARLAKLGDPKLTAALPHLADHAPALAAADQARDTAIAALTRLEGEFCVDLADVRAADCWTDAAAAEAEGLIQGASLLRERSVLEGLLEALETKGLGSVADAYRSGLVDETSLPDAFRCAAAQATISYGLLHSPALDRFQGAQFEVSLDQYRAAAEQFQSLTVQELVSRLSAKIPAAAEGMRPGSSEISVLRRAIKSGGRNLSIRKLFDSIPTLLRRICPCMLMSPISVAQYIDPKFPKFDLVVFDEASQLPTSEAVGAIARGDNVVIVGDPKQLPPTSFFTARHTDEENYDKEDLESVLDDCLALSMPSRHLLWHYRSRHESLIAFSNARFYENKLLTFPSPDDAVRKVTRVPVEGFYDKSKTRQNRAEAEAVVAEIVRRLSDPALRKYSLGVVTFSVVQQDLVDDLLTDAFVKDPQLEQWANEMYEPIFIKNLENVQGDERDVILFSIGYGPDQNGQVSMNFGPLNQDGGWRRLNVAVSRARREMTVFSVLRPDQIDLSRTRAEGVVQLRSFLEFAERGTQALARSANTAVYENDAFAELLADELSRRGYEVRCGVGCSGFRVDAAVVHPQRPGEYILGLMLNSSTNWHTSTSRDRNISQPSVLRGLGWNICNVHILDWLDDPARVLDKLCAEIDRLLAPTDETPAPAEETAPAPKPRTYEGYHFETEEAAGETVQPVPYTPCLLGTLGAPEDFPLPKAARKMADAIRRVVAEEAPVARRAVMKKVMAAWGISRANKAAVLAFDKALEKLDIPATEAGGQEYLWRDDQIPSAYDVPRSAPTGEKRPLDEICPEEMCAVVMYILRIHVSLPKSELVLACAKLLGYVRTTPAAETAVSAGIETAVSRGLAQTDGVQVSLV